MAARRRPVVHLDIKPLACIRRVGHRIHGDRSRSHTGAGYEYAHVAIDDATWVAYVEVRRSQRRRACAAFLTAAVRWVARRGVIVRRVLTDHGRGYRSRRFAGVCRTWQLRHKRTRPYTPRTARPSASSKRCCANGPISGRIRRPRPGRRG
jgi:hypothetical protein